MERNIHLNWQGLVEEAIRRRKEQQLTQQELALIARVSKPTVNQFEQGRTTLTMASVIKILSVLGLA